MSVLGSCLIQGTGKRIKKRFKNFIMQTKWLARFGLIQIGLTLLHGLFYNTDEFEWLKYTHTHTHETLTTWEMGKKEKMKREKKQQHWNSQRVTTVWCELWIMYKWMSRLSRNMLAKSARQHYHKNIAMCNGLTSTDYLHIIQHFQPFRTITSYDYRHCRQQNNF